MSIVKWVVSISWGDKPVEKVYDRETEHFYIRANRQRDSKISRYERFFDTEAEALEFIADRNAKRVRSKEIDQIKRHAVELLEALERILALDCPLTGDASHERLVEFWEYEKTQGRGEADDQLFALAVISKAKSPPGNS